MPKAVSNLFLNTLTSLPGAVVASYTLSSVPSSKCTTTLYVTCCALSASIQTGVKVIFDKFSFASHFEYWIKSFTFTTSLDV